MNSVLIPLCCAAVATAQPRTTQRVTLYAMVRDFQPFGTPQGHPDFERWMGETRVGLVQPVLDASGRPRVQSVTGSGVTVEFRSAAGDAMNPFGPSILGDTPGRLVPCDDARVDSEATFDQWFITTPGVNVSITVPITLTSAPGTNRFIFDSAVDEPYRSRGGFFPIDGQGYGNSPAARHNFSFTVELEAGFRFERSGGQTLRVSADDDTWVFIDGRQVIDFGGVHTAKSQVLELDRLSWLEDGRECTLKLFHGERRSPESSFRIETTIPLRPAQPAAASALTD